MKFPLQAGMEIRRVVARPHETRVYFDGVYFRFESEGQSYSWHPFEDDQLWGFDLEKDQQDAVVRAVEAVVARDADAVSRMLDPDQEQDAGEFWEWVEDDELVRPPGPVDEWEIDALRTHDDDISVEVDMWGREGDDEVPLDETLRLTLTKGPDGWQPQLYDLHTL